MPFFCTSLSEMKNSEEVSFLLFLFRAIWSLCLWFGTLTPANFTSLQASDLWVDSTVPEKVRMDAFVPQRKQRDGDQSMLWWLGGDGNLGFGFGGQRCASLKMKGGWNCYMGVCGGPSAKHSVEDRSKNFTDKAPAEPSAFRIINRKHWEQKQNWVVTQRPSSVFLDHRCLGLLTNLKGERVPPDNQHLTSS